MQRCKVELTCNGSAPSWVGTIDLPFAPRIGDIVSFPAMDRDRPDHFWAEVDTVIMTPGTAEIVILCHPQDEYLENLDEYDDLLRKNGLKPVGEEEVPARAANLPLIGR